MPGVGWQELIVVLIIVVIIFGAGKLPEIGGAMGKSIKEFKHAAEEQAAPLASKTSAVEAPNQSGSTTTVRADEI